MASWRRRQTRARSRWWRSVNTSASTTGTQTGSLAFECSSLITCAWYVVAHCARCLLVRRRRRYARVRTARSMCYDSLSRILGRSDGSFGGGTDSKARTRWGRRRRAPCEREVTASCAGASTYLAAADVVQCGPQRLEACGHRPCTSTARAVERALLAKHKVRGGQAGGVRQKRDCARVPMITQSIADKRRQQLGSSLEVHDM